MAAGGTSGIVWFRRDLRVHDHPALRAALDAPRAGRPGVLLRRPAAARPPRVRAADAVPARVPGRARRRAARARLRAGGPPRPAGARAGRARRARSGARRVHFTADVSPFARRRGERAGEAFEAAGIELRSHAGAERDRRALDRDPGRASRTPSSRRFTATWLETPRRDRARGAARAAGAALEARQGAAAVARSRSGSRRRSPSRRRAARPRRASARPLPATGRSRLRREPRRARRATGTSRLSPYLHFGCSRSAQIEERLPRGDGRGGVSAPALLARLLPPRPAPLPAQRAVGVPGALPRHDQLELRGEARSRRGARAAPASRWSTPGCASCAARAGCTTARGSWSARS